MKWLVVALGFALTATVSIAQTGSPSPDRSALEVVKFSWAKERIGWERDPFGGPVENFDETRARQRNERRIEDAKRGGSAEVDKIKREARADAANIAAKHKQPPSRYVFVYKTTVKNLSDKAIKSIDWDYYFVDPSTNQELARHQFTSDETIKPGKSKEVSVLYLKPPVKTVDARSLKKSEKSAFAGRVVVARLQFSDGSVWQHP